MIGFGSRKVEAHWHDSAVGWQERGLGRVLIGAGADTYVGFLWLDTGDGMGVEGPEEKARYIWSLGIANIIYMGIGIRNIHTSFWVAHIIEHVKLTGLVTSHDDTAHHHSDHLTLLTLATSYFYYS